MNRNGQPCHPLDALLADLRRIWGRDATIGVDRRDGMYTVTVKCRQGGSSLDVVDSHEIPA